MPAEIIDNDDITFIRKLTDEAEAWSRSRHQGSAVPNLTQSLACAIAREVAELPPEVQGRALVKHIEIACTILAASATTHLDLVRVNAARATPAVAAE